MKKVPHLGFQSCQSVIMVLHSIRVPSMIPCVFTTIGNHQTYQATVSAEVLSTQIMHSPARQVVFHLCAQLSEGLTANLLTEVCPNVCIEPPLQALTGELLSHDTSNSEDGARLDISAQGFCGDRHHRAFFDIHAFHPNAPSYRKMQLPSA